MKRLMLLVLGGLLVSSPVFAQAPAANTKAAAKTMTAAGLVTAVAADSLTVKAKGGDMTFAVDKETLVRVAGATRKTAALKDSKTPPAITEYVKVGDSVTVKYHDGATKHAADVLVRSSVKK
jgi:hypothetical protein